MLDKLCKVLEVELGEDWCGNDKNYYKIEEDDILIKFENDDIWYSAGAYVYKHMLLGLIKPVWKPKVDEVYYIPNINSRREYLRYDTRVWENDEYDKFYYNNSLVFKTQDEAIECTNKMLEVVSNVQ